MLLQAWWPRWLGAGVVVVAAVALIHGRGVGGAERAETLARGALRQLGFVATGDAAVRLEGDHAMAWALERSRPGPAGAALALGDGGALRWRVAFSGGGEAVVTPGGMVWSLRRPAPTDPGPDLYPPAAAELLERTLAVTVEDPGRWRRSRSQTWREAGHTWHRARHQEERGPLPSGWRRELEIELSGSTPIAVAFRVYPLGIDLGVVMGRIAELDALARAGVVGVALVVVGMLLAGAEAIAYHEPLAPGRGLLAGCAVAALGWLLDQTPELVAVQALVTAVAVALLPTWAYLPRSRPAWGVAGVALAAVAMSSPFLVGGAGGWMPHAPAPADEHGVTQFLAAAWLPAVTEEPILRGAFPGLLAPVLGWWGAAIGGACLGALFHPLPAVPLVASLAVELLIQLGLVCVARVAGVGGAMLARGTMLSLTQRLAYPTGPTWDAVALVPVVMVAMLMLARGERQ